MKRIKFSIALVIIVLGLSSVWFLFSTKFNVKEQLNSIKSRLTLAPQFTEKQLDDPCWYTSFESIESVGAEKLMRRQNLMMYGYENEITLAEAVQLFNRELSCSPIFKEYPPLTEEEVIAAIIGRSNRNNSPDLLEDKFELIVREKKLPKASLLYFGGGGIIGDDAGNPLYKIKPKGITIYLVLDLDPVNGHKGLKQNQLLLIRQIYTGVEPI